MSRGDWRQLEISRDRVEIQWRLVETQEVRDTAEIQ
jgi:hypothetical protein